MDITVVDAWLQSVWFVVGLFLFSCNNYVAIYIYEHLPVLSLCERISVWYLVLPAFFELSTILFLKICALIFSD